MDYPKDPLPPLPSVYDQPTPLPLPLPIPLLSEKEPELELEKGNPPS